MGYKNPNGYGTIKKLSGKRRRPFAVYITTGYEMTSQVPKIDFLEDILSTDIYLSVKQEYQAYIANLKPRAKQIQKCIGYYATRQEAMIALADYNKNPFDIDSRNVTFEQAYEIIYKEKISKMKPSAAYGYTGAYKKCSSIADIRMHEMKKAHMQKIIDNNKSMSKSALTNIVTLFHVVYKFCLENDIVEKDYSQFVTIESDAVKKEKKPFSRKEVAVVWENIDWLQSYKRHNLLSDIPMVDSILIMLYTGMRIGELFEIKPDDIHLDERWIDLRGTKTKAAKRIVPIHKKIIPLIEKRLSYGGQYLFSDHNNNKLTYDRYIKLFFSQFIKTFNMNHTPHECRHTFASISNASSMNKVLVKKIIGHSSHDITDDIYTHAYIDDLIAEIDKFDL